ncbi:MAG: four helix bundle protein [Deltaproteobacteria bacterium]|nr:four helix bundle protein [Deltaproteobacteria bacterium]
MHWREFMVWQRAHNLVLKCYRVTATFPKTEVYGLVDQIKRAAYSVPSNIVEGQSRNTTKEYLSFLYTARGSLEEVRYFLLLAQDLGFVTSETYRDIENNCQEVSLMLNALIKSLKDKS